jgi:hypothetical protein
MIAEGLVQGLGVSDVGLDETETAVPKEGLDVAAFDGGIVVVVEVIETYYLPTHLQESVHQMGTYEPGRAGHQNTAH